MGTGEPWVVVAVSARIFGILVCLPIGEALQTFPRLFLALCFGAAVSSQLNVPGEFLWYTPLTEFAIGLILATPIRIFAEAAEMLGELLDTARGQTIGSVVDPLNGQQVSDMASLFRIAATVLVIHVGGFDRVFEAVRSSYTFLPLTGAHSGALVHEDLLYSIVHGGLGIVSSACTLSSVWLLAYLLSDLAAALLSKVAHGLCFTNAASIVKMIFTFVLLFNLLRHPTQVTTLARRATESLPTHALASPAQSSPARASSARVGP